MKVKSCPAAGASSWGNFKIACKDKERPLVDFSSCWGSHDVSHVDDATGRCVFVDAELGKHLSLFIVQLQVLAPGATSKSPARTKSVLWSISPVAGAHTM
ncbi:hypothetical protein CD33_12520 [Ureibacillus sinduriensis BLB-1 = JCM 15800]|uniref:Uncharacterized protein n=1 Tax=Ureibacillus sinduriensis BLB-1 = JCM 15800 TaxID=1384057 RepID=A0A0A3HXJ4_9BACL|nr:hypothetical protein CD33_12520 [Ureibacillus sinduriensis BLB-1 = JCM 15800]